MSLISGSNFRGINIFRRGNDRYVTTPDLHENLLSIFNKSEQFVSIDGQESHLLRTTPQLKAVIYRRAEMVSNGIWKHIKENGDDVENSDVIKILNKPNPFQTGNEWMIQNDIQKSTYGNAFTYLLRGSSLATPSALWNLSPKFISVKRTGHLFKQTDIDKIITDYRLNFDQSTGMSQETFKPNEILHRNIQDVDDPIMGTSPFHALKMPISNIRAAYGYRNVIMTEKGAIGLLSNNSKGSAGALPLTEGERKRLENAYTKNHGISDKQRKILMTNASLLWQPMSYPTKEMMLFEEVSDDFRIIIDNYGMDEALFAIGGAGESAGTTFENKSMAEKRVYEDTIIPEGEDLARGMSDKMNLKPGEQLILDYSHLAVLQEDQAQKSKVKKNKAETVKILKETGLYTDSQIRDIVDLN